MSQQQVEKQKIYLGSNRNESIIDDFFSGDNNNGSSRAKVKVKKSSEEQSLTLR